MRNLADDNLFGGLRINPLPAMKEYTVESRYLKLGYLEFFKTRSVYLNKNAF